MRLEKVELYTVSANKSAAGIPKPMLTKSMDLYGMVLQGESDTEKRPQGTVSKRKFTVYIKGKCPSDDIKTGNAVIIRGVTCMIDDAIKYPDKLTQISATEQ